MKRIYRSNPAYSEFQLNTLEDLISMLSKAKNYLITLRYRDLGMIGTLQFDTFKNEKIPGHSVLAFEQHGNDQTRLLLHGDFVSADCFSTMHSESTVVFIKFANQNEFELLIS